MPDWNPIATAPKGEPRSPSDRMVRGPRILVRAPGHDPVAVNWLQDFETFDVRQDRIVQVDGHWRSIQPEARLQFKPTEWAPLV